MANHLRASQSVRTESTIHLCVYIPLTNRIQVKSRTEFFPPQFMAQARSTRAINRSGKKRGSYSTDRENEVSEIFIISVVRV